MSFIPLLLGFVVSQPIIFLVFLLSISLSLLILLPFTNDFGISTQIIVLLLAQPLVVLTESWLLLRFYRRKLRNSNVVRRKAILAELGHSDSARKQVVGFFHPYCNAGGGGERVLWTAIEAMQRTDPNVVSVVYSGDTDATKEQIISKVKARFDIKLDPSLLHFVFLQSRYLIEDTAWPRFTLLGQSLGSMYLAWEAMTKLIPDLYIDSMGYAFTFHVVAQLACIPIGAYVHYPTISTNMLTRVRERKVWHTNTDAISSSAVLSEVKLQYYRFFMYYYAISLRTASFLMVNSSWTKNHVDSILQHSDARLYLFNLLPPLVYLKPFISQNAPNQARIVYPPCDTREMAKFALTPRERIVLSVAQFRPEKDHKAQILAFHQLLQDHPEYIRNGKGNKQVKLVLVGGSRNEGDAKRVEDLQQLVKNLEIESQVEFVINAPYPAVLKWLSRSSIGLSTMVDEHFGINVVEFMAAGVIPVAHRSGGPLQDIVVPFNGERTGFHAQTTSEFAAALHEVLTLSSEEEVAMRWRARAWAVQRFSEEEFERGWNASGWREYLPES